MKDMKLSAKEAKKQSEPKAIEDRPRYPYGLSLSLDSESLDKLGIDKLPALGETMVLTAKVEVTSVHSSDSEYGKSKSVSLQITAMELEKEKKSKSAEELLYSKE